MNISAKKQSGFTIVELLIVVVVIAILAAITIVAFNGIQNRAKVAALVSELQQNKKALETYKTISSTDSYPVGNDCSTSPAPDTICLKTGQGVTYQYIFNNATKVACITGTKDTLSYFVGTNNGPTQGACAGHVAYGSETVTNYFRNPQFTGPGGPQNHSGTSTSLDSYNGSAVAKITAANTSDAVSRLEPNSHRWIVAPGQSVYASGTIYNASSGARSFALGLRFSDSSGTTVGATVSDTFSTTTPQTIAPNASARFSVNATAPAGTVTVSVGTTRYAGTGAAAGDIFYVDNVYLSDTPAGFGDGNTAGWTWGGTPDTSISSGPKVNL